jgi:hypothetical protein
MRDIAKKGIFFQRPFEISATLSAFFCRCIHRKKAGKSSTAIVMMTTFLVSWTASTLSAITLCYVSCRTAQIMGDNVDTHANE